MSASVSVRTEGSSSPASAPPPASPRWVPGAFGSGENQRETSGVGETDSSFHLLPRRPLAPGRVNNTQRRGAARRGGVRGGARGGAGRGGAGLEAGRSAEGRGARLASRGRVLAAASAQPQGSPGVRRPTAQVRAGWRCASSRGLLLCALPAAGGAFASAPPLAGASRSVYGSWVPVALTPGPSMFVLEGFDFILPAPWAPVWLEFRGASGTASRRSRARQERSVPWDLA